MNLTPPSYRILLASDSPAVPLEAIRSEERSDLPSSSPNIEYVPWSSVLRAIVTDEHRVTLYGAQNLWEFDATEEQIYVLKRAFLERPHKLPSGGLREGVGRSGSFPYLLEDVQIWSHGVSIRKVDAVEASWLDEATPATPLEHWIPRSSVTYLKQIPNEDALLFICLPRGKFEGIVIRTKNTGNFVTAENPWPWND